jgi:flagellar biosynthetic protein FliR
MTLRFDMAWLMATLLVSVRVATATAMTSVLGPTQIPAPARVILVMAISALLISAVSLPATAIASLGALLLALASEAIIGLAFAFGFMAAYAATQIAGRILDTQIGFGAAGILNPATQTVSPLLANLFGMLAIAVFLSLDGHLLLFKALSLSLQAMPPGARLSAETWPSIVTHSGVSFVFALSLAGPVMGLLLLSDVALAAIARSMPQLNVLVLGFAIKIMLGMVGLALGIRLARAVLEPLFATTFQYWDGLTLSR